MYLLDTHTILWYLAGDSKLSKKARDILDSNKSCYYSILSFWEIAIKQKLGKLDCKVSVSVIESTCIKAGFINVPILSSHIDTINLLPEIHKDPFDRLLIGQAIVENFIIVTKDELIPNYPVKTLW